MSDELFLITTTLSKSPADPAILDFTVSCRPHNLDEDSSDRPPIGTLSGFIFEHGRLPDEEDDAVSWYFHVFDDRSGHANEAFDILVNRRPLLQKALGAEVLEFAGAVALLERASVDAAFRGRGLSLRLMREAKHVLGRFGLLVILKAHPDGDKVSDATCRALAKYYRSDRWLSLKPLSARTLPGWLVAHWDTPDAAKGDQNYWDQDADGN